MAARANVEIEIKLKFASPQSARAALRKAGFRVVVPRSFEANTLYDTPDGRLRTQGIAVRHRQYRGQHIITYKGPASQTTGNRPGSVMKSREEFETVVPDAAPILASWRVAGLLPSFRYEKYRTVLRRGVQRDQGVAVLDETPIGTYVELEGAALWIDRMAKALGFPPEAYIQASYAALQAEACRGLGISFCDLVFDTEKKFP